MDDGNGVCTGSSGLFNSSEWTVWGGEELFLKGPMGCLIRQVYNGGHTRY